jgi:hypothetical protein
MKLDFCLSTVIEVNSKWIENLNVSSKTIKLLEENMGKMLKDIGMGKGLLETAPKAQETAIADKWVYI